MKEKNHLVVRPATAKPCPREFGVHIWAEQTQKWAVPQGTDHPCPGAWAGVTRAPKPVAGEGRRWGLAGQPSPRCPALMLPPRLLQQTGTSWVADNDTRVCLAKLQTRRPTSRCRQGRAPSRSSGGVLCPAGPGAWQPLASIRGWGGAPSGSAGLQGAPHLCPCASCFY